MLVEEKSVHRVSKEEVNGFNRTKDYKLVLQKIDQNVDESELKELLNRRIIVRPLELEGDGVIGIVHTSFGKLYKITEKTNKVYVNCPKHADLITIRQENEIYFCCVIDPVYLIDNHYIIKR